MVAQVAVSFVLGMASAALLIPQLPKLRSVVDRKLKGQQQLNAQAPVFVPKATPAAAPAPTQDLVKAPVKQVAETFPRVSGASPQAGWQPGQKQPHPFPADSPILELDPALLDVGSIYAFGISAVVPRPIALISSIGADGTHNLAPFSYFNLMHQNPPVVTLGFSRAASRGGDKKDTHANITATGEFVISIISDWFVEAANHTCGEFPAGTDEKHLAGLTPLPSLKVKPQGVAESVINMECKLLHEYELKDKVTGEPTGSVCVCEVLMFRVLEAATMRTPTGKVVVDPLKLKPVCRLGGFTYGRVAGMFDIARPDGKGQYPQAVKL